MTRLCTILSLTTLLLLSTVAEASTSLKAIDTVPTIVMPVRWLEFRATQGSEGVMLQWSTMHEQSIREFEVERSTNSVDFETIGNATATGNSTSFQEYTYFDRSAAPGNNYYRIVSTDENGFKTISILRKVNNVRQKLPYPVQIYNVYASGKNIRLNAVFHHHHSAILTIYTRAGRKIFSKMIQPNSNCIAVEMLKPGVYYASTGWQTFAILLSN